MAYKILLVDDVPVNRKLMNAVLKKVEGTEFIEAEDGEQALKQVAAQEVDLIILDMMMPGKDGFEVLQELKSKSRSRHIPVIVNSAMDDISSIQRALDLGADDYFSKPLTPEQMRVVLPLKATNALKNYDQQKKLRALNDRLKEEMRLANLFQKSIIAPEKDFGEIRMSGRYIPCMSIGGDFYDCVQRGENIWFIIADVTGHGIAPAMISSMIKVLFGVSVSETATPSQVLGVMNQVLCEMTMGGYFFTAFVGMIKGNQLTYANAGQPYPLLRTADGQLQELVQDGFMVGALEENSYEDRHITIWSGDSILLYTDGLMSSNNTAGFEDQTALSDSFRDLSGKGLDLKELLESLTEKLYETKSNLKDDVAVMVIRKM